MRGLVGFRERSHLGIGAGLDAVNLRHEAPGFGYQRLLALDSNGFIRRYSNLLQAEPD